MLSALTLVKTIEQAADVETKSSTTLTNRLRLVLTAAVVWVIYVSVYKYKMLNLARRLTEID